jgi:hypothetical protein
MALERSSPEERPWDQGKFHERTYRMILSIYAFYRAVGQLIVEVT